MPNLCDIETCTSCQACFNACPFDALHMQESKLSTLLPQINTEKCRECGLCEKACPVINPLKLIYPSKAIALYSKNETDRLTCSSGGAATIFSRKIILNGGVCYGATAVGGSPRFIRVDNDDDLELLKGSKYVFCNPGLIYKSVKEDLDAGRLCLFIGLPCNIAALRRYLRKDYTNLITVDLVCHGTPPSEYLHRHLANKVGEQKKIADITFRGKRDFHTSAFDEYGNPLYCKNQYEDEYFTAFMGADFYKPACYQCIYARPERVSDITIGDFWGLSEQALEGYRGKISLALINTEKGQSFLTTCENDMEWEERNVNEAITGNHQLRHPSFFSPKAECFRRKYEESGSLTEAFKASGIKRLTFHNRIRRILLYLPKLILNKR